MFYVVVERNCPRLHVFSEDAFSEFLEDHNLDDFIVVLSSPDFDDVLQYLDRSLNNGL